MNKALLLRILRALQPRKWLYARPPANAVYVIGFKSRWYVPRSAGDDNGGLGNPPDGPQDIGPIDTGDLDIQLRELVASQRVSA